MEPRDIDGDLTEILIEDWPPRMELDEREHTPQRLVGQEQFG